LFCAAIFAYLAALEWSDIIVRGAGTTGTHRRPRGSPASEPRGRCAGDFSFLHSPARAVRSSPRCVPERVVFLRRPRDGRTPRPVFISALLPSTASKPPGIASTASADSRRLPGRDAGLPASGGSDTESGRFFAWHDKEE
jgi:hypothetical protein